jgi:predicted  nucleic acid-binding Zn-ribbon protein
LAWDQSEGSALERSADEDQHSDNTTMSAMFAMMKTYGGLERYLRHLSTSLLTVQDEKRQLQREFDSEVERLQVELAHVTLERDQAVQ